MPRGEGRRVWLPGRDLAHGLLGQPGIAERLIRALGIKGQAPATLQPEFNSSVTVEDLTAAEFVWLRRGNRFIGSATVNAVAAQLAFVLFGPPFASAGRRDILAQTEAIFVINSGAAAQTFSVGLSSEQGFPIVAGTAGVSDDRCGITDSSRAPFCNFFGGNSAAPPNINGGFPIFLPAGSMQVLPVNFTLTGKLINTTGPSPHALQVVAVAVNTPLTVGIMWRERDMLTAEQ